MRKKVYRFTRPATPVVVMTVFLAAIFFIWTNLSIAATDTEKPAKAGPAVSATPPKARLSHVERTDAQTAKLKDALKITPEQQGKWDVLVQVMKDNAKDMDEQRKARTKKRSEMNAVEDMNNFIQVSEIHVAGMKKMVPVFEDLYKSMSDEQKKNADSIFKTGRPGRHAKPAKAESK